MKFFKRIISAMLATVMAFGCFGTVSFAKADDGNMLQNSSFEDGITSWKSNANATSGPTNEISCDGKVSFRIDCDDTARYVYQQVDIDRNKCYEFSAWIKCDNVTSPSGVFLGLLALYENGNKSHGWVLNELAPQNDARKLIKTGGTHGWTKFSCIVDGNRFDSEATGAGIYLHTVENVSGTVYFDRISFKEVDFAVRADFERWGNIRLSTEKRGVPLSIINNTNYERKLNFEYSVMDDFHSPVVSGTDSCSIRANETKKYVLEMPIDRLGQFHFTIRVTSEDGSVDSTIRDSFCVIMQDSSNNPLDDFGLAGSSNGSRVNGISYEEQIGFADLLGAGYWREEIRWEWVEKKKDVFALTEHVQKMYSTAYEKGLKAYVILGYGNVLYEGMPHIAIVPTTQAQLEGWKEYCRYVAQALKDMGFKDEDVFFQTWNEYSGGQSNKTNVPGSHYGTVLKAAYEAVHEVLPNCTVGTDGMAHVLDGKGVERMTEYCESGALDWCDSIDVHPYGMGEQPDDRDIYEDGIASIRNLMKEYGFEDRPFTMSEMGTNIYPDDTYGVYSVREQAINVIRTYVLHKKTQKKYGQKDVMIWFKTTEEKYSVANQLYGIGPAVFDHENTGARLGAASYNVLSTLMNGSEYVEANDRTNVKIHKLKTADDKDMLVMWTGKETEEVSIPCGGNAKFYDMAGSEIDIPVYDGKIQLTLNREPVFAIGNFPTAQHTNADFTLKVDGGTGYKGSTFKFTVNGNKKYAGKKLTFIPDLPDGWEYVNSDAEMYGDGSYDLEVYVPNDSFGNSMNHVRFYVCIDGVPVERIDYQYETLIALSSDSRHLYTEIDGKMQDAIEITIKNESTEEAISGYVSVTAPNELAMANGNLRFEVSAGGCEYMLLPVSVYPEMGYYNFNYSVYQDGVATPYEFSVIMNYMNAEYTTAPPKIDGVFDENEWAGAIPVDIVDAQYFSSSEKAADPVPPDTTGELYAKWDMENLYFAAVINDDVNFNDKPVLKLWDGDSIQIAVDTNREDTATKNWVEYSSALSNDGRSLTEQTKFLAHQSDGENPGVTVGVKRYEDKKQTVHEMMIPWNVSVKQGSTFDPEKPIGISVGVNDNDGILRKGFSHYMNGIVDTKDKLRFGTMYLMNNPYKIDEIALFEGGSKALVDGEVKNIDPDNASVKLTMKNDRILVPARFIAEEFGAKVEWNDVAQEATITKGNTILKFKIGSDTYYVNGVASVMDTTAVIENGRTLLPLRVISEKLGKFVRWDDRGVAIISSKYNKYTDEDIAAKIEAVK